MKQYLAIDIGGTAVKLGIVDEEGRVLSRTEQSVCFDNYETPILTKCQWLLCNARILHYFIPIMFIQTHPININHSG